MREEFKCSCGNVIIINEIIGSFKCPKCRRNYHMKIISFKDNNVEFKWEERK
jgi:predicted RNA-binding Zn-ribbon protein involved in translation (DUF1610 family)